MSRVTSHSKAHQLADEDCEVCEGTGVVEQDFGEGDIQETFCECVVDNPNFDEAMNGDPSGGDGPDD